VATKGALGHDSVVDRAPSPALAHKLLRIYINDHRTGAAAGTALAARIVRRYEGTPAATDFAHVSAQVSEDAASLEDIARRLEITENQLKRQLARAAELIGRLKSNGFVIRPSPLSPVLELEGLMSGIDAKRSLWRALEGAHLPALDGVDFDELGRRATEQRKMLRPHHARAAQAAFAG
jgi:hypothetical protein